MTLHLVTGASRGLGLALAAALLRDGHEVAAAARGERPAELAAIHGGRLFWSRLDLSDLTAARDWARDAVSARSRPEPVTLILNAGMVEPLVPVSGLRPDALDHHLRLNLSSPMMVTAGVLEGLGSRSAAPIPVPCRILAISSGAARYGVPHWSAYCAAKAGLDNFVRAVNAEADPANGGAGTVRAVSLAPGVIDTAMQAVIRDTPAPKRDRFLQLHRDGGLASPDTAAAAILAYLRRGDFGEREIDDLRDAANRPVRSVPSDP
ncbi:MAG: SDR family NAD(P)-dependent oxidoreductase [Gluconacetobacter diazotrophicus]|nr:SDR family NAD(P)-dependent oxidoreductase [Gluconacetobacter diazotrophicus]